MVCRVLVAAAIVTLMATSAVADETVVDDESRWTSVFNDSTAEGAGESFRAKHGELLRAHHSNGVVEVVLVVFVNVDETESIKRHPVPPPTPPLPDPHPQYVSKKIKIFDEMDSSSIPTSNLMSCDVDFEHIGNCVRIFRLQL